MKVGCHSWCSTAASNRPNCSSASFQCAGALVAGGLDALARSSAASRVSASLSPAWAHQRLAHRQARERRVQVDRLAGVAQLRRAGGLARRVAQHRLGEVHQVVVVPVGRIELHHREFGVVPHRDAFVAEAAVDLEHALEAADHQPLQVQLGRDAQEHLLVERVVVRDEGLGVGAARDRVQHRRLHLQEAVLDHEVADRADGLAARHEARARAFVGDQVDIALAVLLLLVGHAVELVGQRAQALGQQAHRGGLDRQLAGLGAEQRALAAEDVAQVPVLEGGQRLGADHVLRDVQLDAPVRVVSRRSRPAAWRSWPCPSPA